MMGTRRIRRAAVVALLAVATAPIIGCQSTRPRPREAFGKVFYVDGAGNWGWGAQIPAGLREAGYLGDIEEV